MTSINVKNTITFLIILLTIIISLAANLLVLKVPIFADGTQHVWITKTILDTGKLPTEDITGIQPSNFSVPISIKEPEPFLYPPLFYILSGSVSTLVKNAEISVDILNILPIFITAIFVFLLTKNIFNRNIALTAFCLTILSNIWPWNTVHRIIEPIIIMLSSATIYFMYKFIHGEKKYLYLAIILCVTLFGIKQTTIPLLFAVFATTLFIKQFKQLLFSLLLFLFLITPIIYYSISTAHVILPSPVGIKFVDNIFKEAWWNQQQQNWENQLDKDANTKNLRNYTYSQFKQVQISPDNLYNNYGILDMLNTFSLYPISNLGTQGYSSTVSSELAPFFILLTIIVLPAIIKIKFPKQKSLQFIFFVVALVIAIIIFWIKQPVFRYYMYILILSSIVYGYSFNFLLARTKKSVNFLLITIFCYLIIINLVNEVTRDNEYRYTAMHKSLRQDDGGLIDSIKLGEKLQSNSDSSAFIFTPMVEIAYYSKKKLLWDNRLFFIDDQAKLLSYLKHYDFKYVVLPFYSGTTSKANWFYDRGIPNDSTFSKLLNNKKIFALVEINNTFTVYKRLDIQ